MWSKWLVILDIYIIVFSLLLGLVTSRLFQISRRIRVIKLHRKNIHYFTIVNVCVLDVWFINSFSVWRFSGEVPKGSKYAPDHKRNHNNLTGWGQLGVSPWPPSVWFLDNIWHLGRPSCRLQLAVTLLQLGLLVGFTRNMSLSCNAPDSPKPGGIIWFLPWHLGVFIVAYAYTHLGRWNMGDRVTHHSIRMLVEAE